MMPPAPPRSWKKELLVERCREMSAMMRPSVVRGAPAAKGAMILTGRFGHVCVCAWVARNRRKKLQQARQGMREVS